MWNAQCRMHLSVPVHSTFGTPHRDNRVVHGPLRAFVTSSGYTLLELLFALVLILTLGAVAAPQLLAAVEDVRAAGAVRYLATKLQQARMEAIARGADVGWQFVASEGGYRYAPYIDGNGNGIRTRDIQRGADPRIGGVERLTDHFAGVDFGVVSGLPPPDSGGPLLWNGSDQAGLEQHPDVHCARHVLVRQSVRARPSSRAIRGSDSRRNRQGTRTEVRSPHAEMEPGMTASPSERRNGRRRAGRKSTASCRRASDPGTALRWSMYRVAASLWRAVIA